MSTFANWTKKLGDNKEGWAPTYWETTLAHSTVTTHTIAIAAAVASYTLPVNAMLVKAQMNINSSGAAANATTITITRLVGDATTVALATDLTGGALSIAAAAGTLYDSTDIMDATFIPLKEHRGAVYTVNVTAVPNAVVADELFVTLGFMSL